MHLQHIKITVSHSYSNYWCLSVVLLYSISTTMVKRQSALNFLHLHYLQRNAIRYKENRKSIAVHQSISEENVLFSD